jgi:hypothetical protein
MPTILSTKSQSPIDRVDQLAPSDFTANYLRKDRPVIINNGAARWLAVKTWSPDYLKNRFGAHPIKARFLARGVTSVVDANWRPEKPRVLGEFVDIMRSQPPDGTWYLSQQPISSLPTDMLKDIGTLDYRSRRMQTFTGHEPYFWMGGPGARTGLHYDLIHNFNIQITGRKVWKLFPRDQQPLLYFGKRDYPHHSEADIFSDNFSTFPLIKQATPYEFELGPGDILFFPDGWAHCVDCIEESISLNFFSLWFRWADIKIIYRAAPPWVVKKLIYKSKAILGMT